MTDRISVDVEEMGEREKEQAKQVAEPDGGGE